MDDQFWKGCQGCVNHDILERTGRSKCLCTGMLYDPAWEKSAKNNSNPIKKRSLLDIIQKLKSLKGVSKNNNKEIDKNQRVIARIFNALY